MALKLVIPPAAEPVTLEQVKAHLRLDGDGDDAWLTSAVAAARHKGESITRRQFVEATYELTLEGFPGNGAIEIPRPPLQSVEWIKYLDTSGQEQTLPPDSYEVDTSEEPGLVFLAYAKTWPATRSQKNAVTVRFVAGWPPGETPEGIQHWMLIKVATMYAAREAVTTGTIVSKVPRSHVDGLLDPYTLVIL